jgi:hypothetical protein
VEQGGDLAVLLVQHDGQVAWGIEAHRRHSVRQVIGEAVDADSSQQFVEQRDPPAHAGTGAVPERR